MGERACGSCGGSLILVASRGCSRSEIVLKQSGTRLELHLCSECDLLTPVVFIPSWGRPCSREDWMNEKLDEEELPVLGPLCPGASPEPQSDQTAGFCLLCFQRDSLIHLGTGERDAVRLDLYRCVACEGLTGLDSGEGRPSGQHKALLEELRHEIIEELYPA